jgi:hypothetical protein|tara:strand:+ start:1172 stop:1930 length:759 start_codon:yes stop_codon:yes gene_type:complete
MGSLGSKKNRKKPSAFNRPTPEQQFKASQIHKYTKGGEFTTTNGEEYIGEYHLRKDGKIYTGPVQNTNNRDTSIQLLPFYDDNDNFVYDKIHKFVTPLKDHTEPTPYTYKVRPAEGVYELGFDTRHFVQRRGLGNFAVEIDSNQRNRFGSEFGIDPNIYDVVDIMWQLTGTIEYIEAVNKDRIYKASFTVADIQSLITNYTQFAVPTKQTEFGNPKALMTRSLLTAGNKLTRKITFDQKTGKIIPPEPLPPR